MSELDMRAPIARAEEWTELNDSPTSRSSSCDRATSAVKRSSDEGLAEREFNDCYAQSLEDLVNTFDERLTECFLEYNTEKDSVQKLVANDQSQDYDEETKVLMTKIFQGDVQKGFTQDHIDLLPSSIQNETSIEFRYINNRIRSENGIHYEDDDPDRDMELFMTKLQQEPFFSIEKVLAEIKEMLQKTSATNKIDTCKLQEMDGIRTMRYKEKLQLLNAIQLTEIQRDLEKMIREFSETLIQELALRDELEYEKELRTSFISLLLEIQTKRRNQTADDKNASSSYKYLTTIIPFDPKNGSPNIETIQILIKILKAMNEDSPAVPKLLTDFILKFLCPNSGK